MASLAQLEACTSELAAAVKYLASHCENVDGAVGRIAGDAAQPLVSPETPREAHLARRSVMANIAKLHILLREPTDFLQQLAGQNQLLACLQWLGGSQVLACIPLSGSVPSKDVADLAGVSEKQLCRVVRMTATAGFLHEPQPGHIAHTALSAPFVTTPSLLDAAMFLSETAAPAALQMAVAAHHFGYPPWPDQSTYNVVLNTSSTFASIIKQRPKLHRQWAAYQRYGMGDTDASVIEVLTGLDWLSLGNASIVDVGARSTTIVTALANIYPALVFIVQISEPELSGHLSVLSTSTGGPLASPTFLSRASTPLSQSRKRQEQLSSRIIVQQRAPGTLQSVHDAAVYILRLPSASAELPSHSRFVRIAAELSAHIDILRCNSSARVVLVARLLPEPGTVDPDVEAMGRLRDLSLLQLANERDFEESEVIDMLNSLTDRAGRLVAVNTLRSRSHAIAAFEIRYQAYTDRHELLNGSRR